MIRRTALVAAMLIASPCIAAAQETHEITVPAARTLEPRAVQIDAFASVVDFGEGGSLGEHLAAAATAGLTSWSDVAVAALTNERDAAFRLRPRVATPRSLGWPVELSLAVEVASVGRSMRDEVPVVALQPAITIEGERFELTAMPALGRVRRPSDDAWRTEFEPRARAAYKYSYPLTLGVDWLGATEPMRFLLLPNATLNLGDDLLWRLGAGWRRASDQSRAVIETRLAIVFGR
jgi:hypothetical protein